MNWFARLFGGAPALTDARRAALAAYQALPRRDLHAPLDTQRFVVVDVESSGLNIHSDRLIAIGAIAVSDGVARLGQSFEVVLRQTTASSIDNILVHGIDGTTQTAGAEPADGLLAFLAFLGNAPLIAYHADFDRAMINRAARAHLGATIANPWIDLAWIAPALCPEIATGRRALDDWTAAFDIANTNRHNAVSDACATAQLLLILLSRARAQGHASLADLRELEDNQRWLARIERR
jgi:DNA polymerase III subunit epsilon